MILDIRELNPDQPTAFSCTYDANALDLDFNDLHYISQIALTGRAELGDETLVFHGSLRGEVEKTCSRCLTKVNSAVDVPFEFTYSVVGMDEVDATKDVKDLLILNHSEQYLCSDNCKGICSQCGKNLNHEACTCEHDVPPTGAWKTLKNFRPTGR